MNALKTEHSNLEIDSKLNRQPVKTNKWRYDVFMSWQWAHQSDCCVLHPLELAKVRSGNTMIGYCNSLFSTSLLPERSTIVLSSKLRNLLIRPILCRWYKHRITMREIDFANHRKVIYPMPFLVGRSPPIWKIGRGNNRDCDITMPPSLKTMEVQIKGDQRNKRFRTVQVNRGFSRQFWTTGTGSRFIFTLWRWSYERSVPFLFKFIETRALTVTTGNRCFVHAQRYSRKVLTLQINVIVIN